MTLRVIFWLKFKNVIIIINKAGIDPEKKERISSWIDYQNWDKSI